MIEFELLTNQEIVFICENGQAYYSFSEVDNPNAWIIPLQHVVPYLKLFPQLMEPQTVH